MDIKENNIVLFQGKPACVCKIEDDGKVVIATNVPPFAVCMHIVTPDKLSEYICPEIGRPCTFTRSPSCMDKLITCKLCEVQRK